MHHSKVIRYKVIMYRKCWQSMREDDSSTIGGVIRANESEHTDGAQQQIRVSLFDTQREAQNSPQRRPHTVFTALF